MGDVKRQRAAQAKWYAGLTPDERTIADACDLLHERLNQQAGFVRACYFYAMFLRKFLRQEKDILVTPIVGWAAYGHNLFGHAWVEYDGKLIDLSLTQTSNPIVAPAGPLIVLDRAIGKGAAYDYMRVTSADIAAAVGQSRLAFSENMRKTVANDDLIETYFGNAAPEHRYESALQRLNAQ
jgi:hypothetical protein